MTRPSSRGSRGAVTASAALVLLAGACSSPGARLHAGYLQTTLSGEIGLGPITSGGVSIDPQTIDVDSSLGLDQASGSPYVRAELDAGPIRVTGSAFRYSQDGQGLLTASFGGIVAGTTVDSSLDLTTIKAGITFDVLDVGPVRISPGLGVDLFDVDARVAPLDTSLGIAAETIDEFIPLPMIYVQAELDFDVVGLVVDAGGFQADYDDLEGSFFDLEAMVYWRPLDNFEIVGGYRYVMLDFSGRPEDQDVDADLDMNGWFVGGGLSF